MTESGACRARDVGRYRLRVSPAHDQILLQADPEEAPVTVIDELLARHVAGFDHGAPGVPTPVPALHLAVLTCMDARIKVFDVFGLRHGEAHILRNAGGVATDDVLRSLSVSQRKLLTREGIGLQHTSCGPGPITADRFQDALGADTRPPPTW